MMVKQSFLQAGQHATWHATSHTTCNVACNIAHNMQRGLQHRTQHATWLATSHTTCNVACNIHAFCSYTTSPVLCSAALPAHLNGVCCGGPCKLPARAAVYPSRHGIPGGTGSARVQCTRLSVPAAVGHGVRGRSRLVRLHVLLHACVVHRCVVRWAYCSTSGCARGPSWRRRSRSLLPKRKASS
jgi:hypothetical protein